MELAHLVRAVSDAGARLAILRPLGRFFVLGALLFGARQLAGAAHEPRRPLRVEVPADVEDPAVDRAIDEAILLDFATRSDWHRSDPIVRERLLRSLSVAEDEGGDVREAIDRAIALGLHGRDPIARQRLLASARRALEHLDREPEPTAAELTAWADAHPDRYQSPARVRFRHVFVSTERRGASRDRDAAAIAAQLAADPEVATETISDPWPWTDASAPISTQRLDAIFGDGFGGELARAPIRTWSGPLRSSFGLHFVRVDEREGATRASRYETRARAEILAASRAARAADRLRSLRRGYDIEIARLP